MNLFWLEYFHYLASIFAILVGVSSFSLFILTYRYERRLRTVWRAVGFLFLAIAFFVFILERKYPSFELLALIFELVGFFSIYQGVALEPNLSHLHFSAVDEKLKHEEEEAEIKEVSTKARAISFAMTIIVGVVLALFYLLLGPYLASAIILFSTLFIIATIRIQIIRLFSQLDDLTIRRQNIYPLIGYIFLLARGILLTLYRLPDLNIVFLRQLKLDYSLMWQLGIVFTLLGFLFLAIWAWNFIKQRVFLRTYVLFLTIAIVVSSLGSLVFTSLIFRIVEGNNLELMMQATQAQEIVMSDRSKAALFLARTIGMDPAVISAVSNENKSKVEKSISTYFNNSSVDTLRVFNNAGMALASPSDIRETGVSFAKDSYVAYVLTKHRQIKTFDRESSVLSGLLVARGFYPIINSSVVVGAVEVGYKFDNAYVDFAKQKTGLDVTMYTDLRRSATTIKTIDQVSRWTGSEETDKNALFKVIEKGESYKAIVDRLGQIYYSAFRPVRNINGQIIGMISVGTPTIILFEDTRQQLLSTFLIVILISLSAALLGYYVILSFRNVAS